MKPQDITIKLSKERAEAIFFDALCNAIGTGYTQQYGLELVYDKKHYEEAKNKLKEKSESVCYEDVLLQILKDGNTLTMKDIENEGEYTRTISIYDVHNKVEKVDFDYLYDMINENGDASTSDAIIQTVFFDEIIFG